MKALTLLAVLFGLGALGASIFAKVETFPNYQYMATELSTRGPATQYDVPLLAEHAQMLQRLHIIAWVAGAIALILGAIALGKTRAAHIKTPLPVMAMLFGVVGAGLSVLSAPPWL